MLERYYSETNSYSSHWEWVNEIKLYTILKIKVTLLILFMFYMVATADIFGACFVGLILFFTAFDEIAIFERDEAYKIRELNI